MLKSQSLMKSLIIHKLLALVDNYSEFSIISERPTKL